MRELIYIPIIHTESDMGTMSGSIKKAYLNKYSQGKWQQHATAINEMWEGIHRQDF